MRNLRYYIRPYMWIMAAGLLIKAFGTFLELLLPEILSRIIDIAVPAGDRQQIFTLAFVMLGCALGAWILNILANRNASNVARNITRNIRHDLFEHTLYLSCEKTDSFTIPSLEGRLTSDTYHLHRMIGMMQRMGIRAPIIVIGSLAVTFFMEPVLSLVFVSVIPFMFILVYFRATRGVPMFGKVQKANDKMTAVVRENAQGIRVIKSLSREEHERQRFDKVNDSLRGQEVHANEVMAVINPMMNMFLYIGMIGVIIVGAYRISRGESETGKIIAFMSYFQMISRSLMASGRMFIMFSRGMASSGRIMEVLNTPTERDWKVSEHPDGDPDYALEFRNVTFSYLKVRDNVKNISFRLKQGESLGIIGATGSGKSTLLSLLLHFYDIDNGAIYLNGKDIRGFEPTELRRNFGIVMQNDFLFGDTIAENIRFGREVDDEEMWESIEHAQAAEFITQLDERQDHVLTTKGTNVSGGQRQRILLARALSGNPAFLLLDDSSSALDYRTDAALRKALAAHYENAVKVIIAQRVSSVKNCDQIIVMDHGEINGIGTHEELQQNNALYASICDSQMGGALFE